MKLTSKQIKKIDTTIKLCDNKIIVEIDVSENKGKDWSDNEICYNIYCINENYNIIWQVKEIKTIPPFNGRDPFCYLDRNNNGEIIAGRFSGFVYKINPETGEAEQTGFRK